MEKVRVRFAPSPTGLLHIGGARTALFNWLYAKHTGGTLVLRIEDTDEARNTQAAVDIIFQGLRWLGLDWEEGAEKGGDFGPYFQSQRKDIYSGYVERLLKEGKAYEEDGAVKFRMPKTPGVVDDMICGQIRFDRTTEPDLVIRRSNGLPVFHLVNVIDDLEMKITHVIRGEDHLSNTHKHLALFEALGAQPPRYAHIPLILNVDGSKMSKRDEGASIGEYIEKGYLPEAVINYLCLLGWSPKDNREVFPISEVVEKFDLPQVNRSNAKFDINKLFWINGEYMRAMPKAEYASFARDLLLKAGTIDKRVNQDYFSAVAGIVQEKIKLGRELPEWTQCFFSDDYPVEQEAATKYLGAAGAEILGRLHGAFAGLQDFKAAELESALKALSKEMGKKTGELVHPCRVAVSGRTVGPSLYHMLEVMGRERVLARLKKAGGA